MNVMKREQNDTYNTFGMVLSIRYQRSVVLK